MPDTDDLYEILQVHHAAEPEVVEAAYRRLARKYHPDVNKSDQAEGMMAALNRAYEVLGDPDKRAAYDRERGGRGRDAAEGSAEQVKAWGEYKLGADVSQMAYRERVNQLFWAAHYGDPDKVQEIISSGVDVNERDYEKSTPLHIAAAEGHLQTAQVLVISGASVDLRDYNGYTPLYLAGRADNLRVVQMLAANGADVKAKDKNGFTPLHIAAFDGNTEVAMELIRLGGDVNAKARGYTPLDVALVAGHDSTVSALVVEGAKVGQQKRRGRGGEDIDVAGLLMGGAMVLGTLASIFLSKR